MLSLVQMSSAPAFFSRASAGRNQADFPGSQLLVQINPGTFIHRSSRKACDVCQLQVVDIGNMAAFCGSDFLTKTTDLRRVWISTLRIDNGLHLCQYPGRLAAGRL